MTIKTIGKRILIPAFYLLFISSATAQETFTEKEVAETLLKLSADELGGRQAFGPHIFKAANLIADGFKLAGLKESGNSKNYLQEFTMIRSTIKTVSGAKIGTEEITPEKLICQCNDKTIKINQSSGYEVVRVAKGENAMVAFRNIRGKTGNVLVLMDVSNEPFFNRVKQNNGPRMKGNNNIVFVLTENAATETFNLDLEVEQEAIAMANVVGILPGKSKPDEYVIFSGHYDHIGIGKPNEKGDSIYNGANDDASGTTAVMMLAKHFAKTGDNERTLVFAAFTAEEVGGFGSQYFSKQFEPAKVMAMFNIEMIGTDSKWGTNSAYITGFEKSSMGEILQKNLEGSGFQFYPDPYPQQQLFYRSDNATLARLGVPAHTISTSKMDSEPHYHKQSDEISTLDTKNMTEIIKSIAISSKSIIAGRDTPSRVDTTQLR
jgi:hypothetical protein